MNSEFIVFEIFSNPNILLEIEAWMKNSAKKYRISEWAEFQVWKFLHLQKLAHGEEKSRKLASQGP